MSKSFMQNVLNKSQEDLVTPPRQIIITFLAFLSLKTLALSLLCINHELIMIINSLMS